MISARGVATAARVARVASERGLGPADVDCFGAMPSVLGAFDWVREGGGRAVAMANAHPDVLAAATDVTDAHTADGVAVFLASLPR